MPLPKISIVAVDLPPEDHHQKRETSNKPESIDPDRIFYVVAEGFLNFVLWLIGINLKFNTFFSTLRVLISVCESIEHPLDLICERPWLGSISIVPFILWIPIIILAWYSLVANKWKFLWPYIIYGIVFFYIDAIYFTYILVQSTSIKEVFSNPKVREVASDFTTQRMSNYFGCALYCFIYFAVAKLDRVKVVIEKIEA